MTSAVKRLILHKMSVDAIPPGGDPFAAGVAFLSDAKNIADGYRAAEQWVREAIEEIRRAREPNPWKEAEDEAIAAELLRQINARKARAVTGAEEEAE